MLGKIEGRKERGWRRTGWLYGITDSMEMSLIRLQELVMDREAWWPVVHGVTKNQTWQWLNWSSAEEGFNHKIDRMICFVDTSGFFPQTHLSLLRWQRWPWCQGWRLCIGSGTRLLCACPQLLLKSNIPTSEINAVLYLTPFARIITLLPSGKLIMLHCFCHRYFVLNGIDIYSGYRFPFFTCNTSTKTAIHGITQYLIY